mmetsp:Transcript_78198/g.147622  ORF Transcript_78198/g.147622 Transcript_78198/m.147622 type:complete len:211 (-) Transcript_78198:515-1147(-)
MRKLKTISMVARSLSGTKRFRSNATATAGGTAPARRAPFACERSMATSSCSAEPELVWGASGASPAEQPAARSPLLDSATWAVSERFSFQRSSSIECSALAAGIRCAPTAMMRWGTPRRLHLLKHPQLRRRLRRPPRERLPQRIRTPTVRQWSPCRRSRCRARPRSRTAWPRRWLRRWRRGCRWAAAPGSAAGPGCGTGSRVRQVDSHRT